jgi:hypothetical protein
VYSLQICQLVIIRIHTRAEEQPGVATVHNLVIAELDEVGLVFLVAGRDEAVHLLLSEEQLEREGEGEGDGDRGCTSPFSFIFSSSLYGAYHFARRVFPLLDSSAFKTRGSGGSERAQLDAAAEVEGGNVLPVLD